MGAPRPPMEYLAKCSQESLESIELARLSRAANLRKEFQQLIDEWVSAEVDARFARVLLEWRRARASAHVEPVATLDASETIQLLPHAPAFQPAAQRQLAFSFAAASSPQLTVGKRRLAPRVSREKRAVPKGGASRRSRLPRELAFRARSLERHPSRNHGSRDDARRGSCDSPCIRKPASTPSQLPRVPASLTNFTEHRAPF